MAICRTTVFSMSSTLPASRAFGASPSVSRFSKAWKVSISPNTDAVSASVSGVGQQLPLRTRQDLMHAVMSELGRASSRPASRP